MTPWFMSLFFLTHLTCKQRPSHQEIRFEKDSRYYIIRLTKDLFDDWVIVLVNGRINSKLGQSRTIAFDSFNEGFDSFCALAKLRFQRRYQVKTLAFDNHLMLHIVLFMLSLNPKKDVSSENSIGQGKKMNNLSKNAHLPTEKQLGFAFL